MESPRLNQLIPHRPPMLLLDEVLEVSKNQSKASVSITSASAFYTDNLGVPAWIGLEYMGQTAALIAGYQLEQGQSAPHRGLLLGTRHFHSTQAWFPLGANLMVSCVECALVGTSLANFDCEILDKNTMEAIAKAKLSVLRQPIEERAH